MIIERPSPNFSERSIPQRINAIVIHDTGGHDAEGTLGWFEKAASKVSAHYVIGKDGALYRCVDDEDKAWHAGSSILHGEENVNDFSIGIELVDNNDGEPYPDEQIGTLIALCVALVHEYKIPLNRIVGHNHVAPGRKKDPGPDFPWYDFMVTVGARVADLQFTDGGA